MIAVVEKEVLDLVRRKPVGIVLLVAAVAYGAVVADSLKSLLRYPTPGSAADFWFPLGGIGLVGYVTATLLALLVGADAFSRERELGTESLLLSAGVPRWHLFLGKLARLAAAYAAFAVVTLAFTTVLTAVYGPAAWVNPVWFLLVPLAAWFVLVGGFALLAGTLLRSSTLALAASVGTLLLLGLLELALHELAWVATITTSGSPPPWAYFLPMASAGGGIGALTGAAPWPWGYALAMATLGGGAAAVAYVTFAKREAVA